MSRLTAILAVPILVLVAGCGADSNAPAPDPTTAAPTTNPAGENPGVYADCEKASSQPKEITVACGDGNFVMGKITWDSWGEPEAGGTGTAEVNLCEPSCADGKVANYEAGVTLSDIQDCAGKPAYTAIEIDFMDESPKGFDNPYKTTLGCGAG